MIENYDVADLHDAESKPLISFAFKGLVEKPLSEVSRSNLGFISLTFPNDMKELNREPASILQSTLKNFEE